MFIYKLIILFLLLVVAFILVKLIYFQKQIRSLIEILEEQHKLNSNTFESLDNIVDIIEELESKIK